VLFILLCLCLSRIPFRLLKSGWIPISIFLLFTFFSNVFNQQGRILYTAGSVLITQEGLQLAGIRTVRILLMICGVKFLMATTSTDTIIHAMARLLGPIEKAGVPVRDFFHTMGLTLKCFPILQDSITAQFRKKSTGDNSGTMWNKARKLAMLLLPLFVESIRSPELFFREDEAREETH
jgi:energy-coupling factor transport system permease protein